MRIRITGFTEPQSWYKDKIGDEFEVLKEDKNADGNKTYITKIGRVTEDYVDANDCVVLDEDGNVLVSEKFKVAIDDFTQPTIVTHEYHLCPQFVDKTKYSHLTKKQREAKIENVRTEPKIGRNSFCPCGSGKKYKNCCIKN